MSLQLNQNLARGSTIERRKDYAVQMLKTALRYSNDAEVSALTAAVEAQISIMLASRYSPGLNDASYHVFRKFWLAGGVQ